MAFEADLLDDAIGGAAGLDDDAVAEAVERLVMGAVDVRDAQFCVGFVGERLEVGEAVVVVVGDVEIKGAAAEDVEDLEAAADAEEGDARGEGAFEEREFDGVTIGRRVFNEIGIGHGLAQEALGNIGAATEHEPIDVVGQRLDAGVVEADVGIMREGALEEVLVFFADVGGDRLHGGA